MFILVILDTISLISLSFEIMAKSLSSMTFFFSSMFSINPSVNSNSYFIFSFSSNITSFTFTFNLSKNDSISLGKIDSGISIARL